MNAISARPRLQKYVACLLPARESKNFMLGTSTDFLSFSEKNEAARNVRGGWASGLFEKVRCGRLSSS
jgi:hypothetical protein